MEVLLIPLMQESILFDSSPFVCFILVMSISNKYVVVKSNKGAGLGDNLCVVSLNLVSVLYGRK